MRALRYVLQAVITVFFVLALAALSQPPFSPWAWVAVLALFGLLLLLVLLLREYTEYRLRKERGISPRVVAALLGFCGIGACVQSFEVAAGRFESLGRRGAIITAIADVVGPWPPALVLMAMGLFLLYLGYRAFRSHERIQP